MARCRKGMESAALTLGVDLTATDQRQGSPG